MGGKVYVYLRWGYSPYPEIIHSHCQGVHDFSINGLILQVNEIHLLADGLQGSL